MAYRLRSETQTQDASRLRPLVLVFALCTFGCQELADIWAPTQELNEDLQRKDEQESVQAAQTESRLGKAKARVREEVEWMNTGPPADRAARIRWLVVKRVQCTTPECSDNLLNSLRAEGDLSPVLLELVRSPEVSIRMEAIVLLGLSGDAEVASELVPALRDQSPLVRRAATSALGWLKSADSVTPLVERLREVQDSAERSWLLRAMTGLPGPAPLQAFRRAALSGDVEQAHAGLQGLRTRGGDEVVPLLMDVVKDGQSLSVKQGALDILAALDSRLARRSLRRAGRSRNADVRNYVRSLR